MGKQGPCHHCGVTSTPLWRNGPPEKPVLCNACGSRWRTKGSLSNYTPLHCREPLDLEEFKASKVRSICLKAKESLPRPKKLNHIIVETEHEMPYSDQNFRKLFDRDTSNRSSSGSAISYSESCAYFGNTDASDLTGSAQSNVWDPLVPSKKRTCFARPKPSPVEKLTKDLHSILHEQQSFYLSGSSEEDLLYGSETPIGSGEIGHGGVLLRYPNSKIVEEESEASSLPIDNTSFISESCSGPSSFLVRNESKRTSFPNVGVENFMKPTTQLAHGHVKREKLSRERLNIVRARDSPLRSTDLKDIVTLEVFTKHMTLEEQQKLMRYLPSTDIIGSPESLKSMFQSPQFVETLSYFQQLLREGLFDHSSLGAKNEESRALKRLVLQNLTKSKWVEQYKTLKDVKQKQITGGKEIMSGRNFLGNSGLTPLKRPHHNQIQYCHVDKGNMRSPKSVSKTSDMNLPSTKSSQLMNLSDAASKLIQDVDDLVDNEGAGFSLRSIFATPPDQSSMLLPFQFTDESSDQDLLLDLPSNSSSFPEAELLVNPWNRTTGGEQSLSSKPSSSCSNQHQSCR